MCYIKVYLHKCNEEEEGIGSSSDLLIQKPGQKGENPIFGGTEKEWDLFIWKNRKEVN